MDTSSDSIALHRDILLSAFRRLCGDLDERIFLDAFRAVELVRAEVGDVLYHQGEPGDCMHVVLTGRLQVKIALPQGGQKVIAHLHPGEVAGEMALLSGASRAATVIAVRDTTLAVIKRSILDVLSSRSPQVFSHITRMIIQRLGGSRSAQGARAETHSIMVIGAHGSIDMRRLTHQFRRGLLPLGSVGHLNSTHPLVGKVDSAFGVGRLFDDFERNHDYVILEADPGQTLWNRQCSGYADRIVVFVDATKPCDVTEVERWLYDEGERNGAYAPVELVFLHPENVVPVNTASWLSGRPVRGHYQVRLERMADMRRLARCLCDKAVTLVLAGGGARGFAHIGVIRAMQELGLPVDAVGGTSFGALAGTGLARDVLNSFFLEELRVAFVRDDPMGDYTIPIISLVKGEHLNEVLSRHLPMNIEDLWLPFFAVSSDLSSDKLFVHRNGPLWKAIRASVSLPAILPPAINDGHMLVDGGVLNNLPVDIMKERVRGNVIAVDLAVKEEFRMHGEQIPSRWHFVRNKLMPGGRAVLMPTLSRVIMKATTMASRQAAEQSIKSADVYINPPLGAYDFLDWGRLAEIVEVGYRHALPILREWAEKHPELIDRDELSRAWQSQVAEVPAVAVA